MRCLSPRKVGFQADGKTIAWSQKNFSKEYAPFSLPCSKCIECRLEYARTWAIRCVHEAQMHEENAFITLTYDDAHLTSPKLIYADFQKFMKRLRFANANKTLGLFVTGEYGELNKRPHWHALIFNWRPNDLTKLYTNHNGDQVYASDHLSNLWGCGMAEVGSVTFESAGYVARYAAKKLVHGHDADHDYHPISKKSQKNAIGKKYLEKYYTDIFNYGYVEVNGLKLSIPRYYEKWFQKHKPEEYLEYVYQVKTSKQARAEAISEAAAIEYRKTSELRQANGNFTVPITEKQVKTVLINEKFKRLQQHLKGDI